MQLKELDKKAILDLKDRINELEGVVSDLSVIRQKYDLPLEIILREHPYYKDMMAYGYEVGERITRRLWDDKSCYLSHELDYSRVLESGKTYTVLNGLLVAYALKIIEGTGLFDWCCNDCAIFSFPVLEGEKYVLFPKADVCALRNSLCVKEIEGHIRYVCAMSTFLDPKIEEVK
jgi:hypothetical protein